MRLVMISVLMVVLSISSFAFTGSAKFSGSEYERHANYILKAPSGWIQSHVTAREKRVQTAFLPENVDWDHAEARIYSNMEYMDSFESLEDIIAFDMSNYLLASPKLNIQNKESITTADGNESVVKHLLGTSYGTWEAIAYVPQGDRLVFIILSADSEKSFTENLSAFEALVSSYDAPGLVIK